MSNLTIQPISLNAPRLTASPVTTSKTSRTQQPIQQIDSQVLQSALTVNEQDDEANLEVAKSGKAKGHGVLRLLNEGHFNGVADVRLRINFFDQLSAQQETQSLTNLNEQSTKLIGSIQNTFNESVSTLTDDAETKTSLTNLYNDFESTLQDTLSHVSIRDLDPAALETSIQTSFDSFVEQLSQTLTTPAQETDAASEIVEVDALKTTVALNDSRLNETVNITADVTALPVDQTSETTTVATTSTLDDAMTLFKEAFSQALTEFTTSLETTSSLQDLSSYDGNGVAYDKFLAIYNDLRGVTTTVDELI